MTKSSLPESKAESTWVQTRPDRVPASAARIESLHLFVLATFAITQPIYDRVGERPVFLIDSNVGTPAAILILAAIMSLLVPALVPIALWCIGTLAPRARGPLHAVAVYLFLLLIALPIAKRIESYCPDWLTIGLGLGLAGGATWAYFAFRRLRSVVTVATAGIVVFPILFLFQSPVAALFSTPEKIETASWKPVPVVMVVFDEFCGLTLETEERQIDAARFPRFAELARGSTWYRNASTVFPDTSHALPALLSGKRPETSWVPRGADLPQNLFSVLKATGDYEFAVFEPISRLAPHHDEQRETAARKSSPVHLVTIVPTLARVFLVHLAPSDLQKQLPKVPPLWFGLNDGTDVDRAMTRGEFRYRWGDDRRSQFEHFIECIDDSAEPALHFFHVLLPHVPWCYLPSGRRYLDEVARFELLEFDTQNDKQHFWGTDELYVTQSQQRYLLQLEFVDRMLGRLIDRLRSTGLYDKCLLLVTADHGISFKVGQSRRSLTPGNAAEIMSIPLFIKLPGQQTAAISDKNVESIDILPTIAEALRIKLPLPVDGHSIINETLPERPQKTILPFVGEQTSFPASVVNDRTISEDVRARFGSSADPDGIFRIGPHPELIGREIADLMLTDASAIELELHRFGTRHSDDRDEVVPCYFEGRVVVPHSIPEPIQIAVAINGIIRGVTRTYELNLRRENWAILVPEQAFRVGENDVQFYAISGQAPELRLNRCTTKIESKKK